MADNTKRKTVNYRRCEAAASENVGNGVQFDLQALLTKASEVLAQPWIRPIGIDEGQDQYLIYLVQKHGCLCGTLVLCEGKKMIPLVDAELDGSPWEGKIPPHDEKGKKRKLEEQTLVFAIRENHLAIVQTKELSIADLQDFLVWMIQTKAQLARDWDFHLINVPSKKAVEKLREQEIRSVRVGKQAFWVEPQPMPAKEGAKRKRYTRVLKSDPMLLGVLEQWLHNDALIEELKASKDPGSVHVALEISYRSRSQKDAQHLMRAVAATFGGNSEFDSEIRLKGKSRIRGNELTIADDLEIQYPDGNIAKDDAMTRVSEWLIAAIKDHKVLT